ncbi:MAG: hypothetical protein JSV86_13100 [Gemmatimonadota bacterium]|nr:MAG: hypothetical protein JSV86_13100 [Gemmatimonadota bacterium]
MSNKTKKQTVGPTRVQITNFSRHVLNFPIYTEVQMAKGSRRKTVKTIRIASGYKPEPGSNRVIVTAEEWEQASEGSKMIPALLAKGMAGGIEVQRLP